MSTQSGRTYKGRLNDAQRDELLISIAERLNNLEFTIGQIQNPSHEKTNTEEQVQETRRNVETNYNAHEEATFDVEEHERHDCPPPPRPPQRTPPQPLFGNWGSRNWQ